MRNWAGWRTGSAGALVHEAYLKLAGQRRLPTGSRAHFLAIASKAMRHILCPGLAAAGNAGETDR